MRYLLALGSNVGDRLEHLVTALCALEELGTLGSLSGIYETDPVGYTDQGAFYNMAASLESDLEPEEFITALNALQQRLGKAVPFPNGPRTIDIDILLADDEVRETPALTLPHPRLHERLFVLHPLAEIAPLAIHPVLSVTIENLMGRLDTGAAAARVVTPEALWERIWASGT